MLARSRVLELFSNLGVLVARLVILGFFRDLPLDTILNYGLLTDALSHAASHSPEAAALEGGEATAETTSSKEVVVVHHHGERVTPLLLLSLLATLLPAAATVHAHLFEETTAHHASAEAETAPEEIIIVVEEAGERISTAEELPEDVVSVAHVKVSTGEAGTTSTAAVITRTTLLEELSPIAIIILALLRIREDTVRIGNLLKDLLGFFLIIWVLIGVVLERQLLISFLYDGQLSVFRDTKHLV